MSSRVVVVVVAVLMIVVVGVVAGDDVTGAAVTGPNGIQVVAKKQSGRIFVWRQLQPNKTTDTIAFSLSSLRQIAADGMKTIPDDATKKNSFSGFDNLFFAVAGPVNMTLNNSNGVNVTCNILTATLQDISSSTTIQVDACATLSNGTLQMGNETTAVYEGEMKFSVRISNWAWAVDAAYLDLVMVVNIPSGQYVQEKTGGGGGSKKPRLFVLGGGASANFSTQVEIDEVWRPMPSDYPRFDPSQPGTNQTFTIRFPRFNSTGEYDPIVDPGSAQLLQSTSEGSSSFQSSITLQFVCLLAATLGLLIARL